MSESQEDHRLTEAEVKLSIGEWLTRSGLRVFDEKPNRDRPKWGVFQVTGISRGRRPDLVVRGDLQAVQTLRQGVYVALEIKRGYKHHDILDGFDATLDYFSDYLWGAEYWIDDKPIDISAFVFATLFSERGFLFEGEGKFDPRGIVRGPWDAYPMTFTISRLLWRQKDNLVKRLQALSGIPRVEKKLKGTLHSARPTPEIGVIVKNPANERVRLMLSESPYHWQFGSEGLR